MDITGAAITGRVNSLRITFGENNEPGNVIGILRIYLDLLVRCIAGFVVGRSKV